MADLRWRFGIGDPTAVGWLTVAAYAATAALSVRAFLRSRARRAAPRRCGSSSSPGPAVDETIWLLIAITMLLLGINKQLDLQTSADPESAPTERTYTVGMTTGGGTKWTSLSRSQSPG